MEENRLAEQTLEDAYERLERRRKIYKKATFPGDILWLSGFLILYSSFFALIFGGFLHMIIVIFVGIILMYISRKVAKKAFAPPKLTPTEREFLNVFKAHKDLETYFSDKIDLSKSGAAKKISRFMGHLYDPTKRQRSLWAELIKDKNKNKYIRLLKENLEEKLLPTINMGKEEEVKMAHNIIKKIAEYLLDPKTSVLEDLNESMSELPTYEKEEGPSIPFFERYPKLKHVCVVFFFSIVGIVAYLMGVTVLNISPDSAYIATLALFGALTAGYMLVVSTKISYSP